MKLVEWGGITGPLNLNCDDLILSTDVKEDLSLSHSLRLADPVSAPVHQCLPVLEQAWI